MEYYYQPFEEINVFPKTFKDLLEAPCRVINLDRNPERWEIGEKKIKDAGFTNYKRVSAVDAKDTKQLEKGWSILGNPKFADWDKEFKEFPGKQGCFLSHFKIWKEIIDNKIPYMVILEDDVMFHPKWKDLAPEYFQNTPKNFDVLYLGAQFEFNSKFHIDIGPVFCTHAMVVTYNGAKKLWEMLLNRKLGVYTIDCMIIDSMKHRLMTMNNENSLFKSNPFTWYVWNGNFYPTEIKNMPKDWTKRNSGLVFQDESFGSEVREW
jgi:GR25 family glycosyltransferase involved in LPS biosynthesis